MTKLDIEISSVSDLVGHIKKSLEETFSGIAISGEVSNLSLSSSGHWYFTLSDSAASLSCVLFKGDSLRNPLIKNLKNGDEIILMGEVSVFEKRGVFQFICKRLLPKGEGKLRLEFEKLKRKLSQEGLFDSDRKKSIPAFPEKIILITAPQSAALQDFLKVYERRSLGYELLIIPTLVQGDQAAGEILKALRQAYTISGVDVIVLLRGGGSAEDLAAFNDESLVRKIAEAPCPIVSAIGHQTDFCLSDFVADLRAETPTAAAELLSQEQTSILQRMDLVKEKIFSLFQKSSHDIEQRLWAVHPQSLAHVMNLKITNLQMKIIPYKTAEIWERMIDMASINLELDEALNQMNHFVESKMTETQHRLEMCFGSIRLVSPDHVLKRGYSYVSVDHKPVSSKKEWLASAEQIKTIHFIDGKIKVKDWEVQ